MAAIYDKALKRKDYSGIIDKNKIKQDEEAKIAESNRSKSRVYYFYRFIELLTGYEQRRAKPRRRLRKKKLRRLMTRGLGPMSGRLLILWLVMLTGYVVVVSL